MILVPIASCGSSSARRYSHFHIVPRLPAQLGASSPLPAPATAWTTQNQGFSPADEHVQSFRRPYRGHLQTCGFAFAAISTNQGTRSSNTGASCPCESHTRLCSKISMSMSTSWSRSPPRCAVPVSSSSAAVLASVDRPGRSPCTS